MAYRGQYPAFPQGFRQDITYEQVLKEQANVCRDALNEGDRDFAEKAITTFSSMITEKMEDAEFIDDVHDLDDEWKRAIRIKEVARKKQLLRSAGGCPDLIPPVNERPSLAHLNRQFRVILNLLERKKMLLKYEVDVQA